MDIKKPSKYKNLVVLLEANVNKAKEKIGNAFVSLVLPEKTVQYLQRLSVKIMKTTMMVRFLAN